MNRLKKTAAARFARRALDNLVREYPNHVMHLLSGDTDAQPPRVLHPAFYGSYDWHSAVHSHWLLVRVLRLFPRIGLAAEIRALLDRHLTPDKLVEERRYFEAPHRAGFERPYGLAWLLQLAAELHAWNAPEAQRWRTALVPLEELAVSRFSEWLPKLSHPVRSGEHANSAFALGLLHDYACRARHRAFEALIKARSLEFYSTDTNAPLAYEPSGQDFLSPVLSEADLMRRLLPQQEFAAWLTHFLPQISAGSDAHWLPPVVSRDRADGKLAHLDGLNLSRAWMLEGIATALPADDPRQGALIAAARDHAAAGLAAVTTEHYAGSHWLPSFAVYLLSRRGMARG